MSSGLWSYLLHCDMFTTKISYKIWKTQTQFRYEVYSKSNCCWQLIYIICINSLFTSSLIVVYMRLHFCCESDSRIMCGHLTAFAKFLYLFWTLLPGQEKTVILSKKKDSLKQWTVLGEQSDIWITEDGHTVYQISTIIYWCVLRL